MLAQDVASVEAWYEQQKQQPSSTSPIFYCSDDGMVPLLYFAIRFQNASLIRTLIRCGHRVTFPISHETKGDRAVLFSALEPQVDASVVEALLQDVDSRQEQLHHLFWLDRNPLHTALSQRCSVQVIRLLLTSGNSISSRRLPLTPPIHSIATGGPLLLCLRNADGQTGRDLAVSLSLAEHVRVIDQVVTDWLLADGPRADHQRSLLALCSYELNMVIRPLLCRPAVHCYQQEFTRLQVSRLFIRLCPSTLIELCLCFRFNWRNCTRRWSTTTRRWSSSCSSSRARSWGATTWLWTLVCR